MLGPPRDKSKVWGGTDSGMCSTADVQFLVRMRMLRKKAIVMGNLASQADL